MPPDSRTPKKQLKDNAIIQYAATLVLVAAAFGLRQLLDPALGDHQPFFLFIAPVLVMAWWAGAPPAIVAAVLGLLIGDYFFEQPRGRFLGGGGLEIIEVLIFVAISAVMIIAISRMRSARERLLCEIAETRRASGALQKQAQLIDLAPAATLVREMDGLITFWSHGAESLYGWKREEAVGKRSHDLLRTEFPEPLDRIVEGLRGGGRWSGELVHHTKDGRLVTVESHWLGRFAEDGSVAELLESNTDITERKKAELALKESEARLSLASRAGGVGLFQNDYQLGKSTMNDVALRLFGFGPGAGPDLPLEEVQGRIHRGDWPRVWGALQYAAGHKSEYEAEFRVHLPDRTTRWILSRGAANRGPDGGIRTVGAVVDITDRKRAEEELRRLKDELEIRVQQRTAELSTANKELEAFGYSVSHDLRAPLRHVDSYIKLLEKSIGSSLDQKNQKYLRIIMDAAKRMGSLIDDLLILSRLSRAVMEEQIIDLRALVDEVRQELSPATSDRAIEWHIGPLPKVHGDPNLLRSVVSNLLSNAVKYTRKRELAVIEVGCKEVDHELVCFIRDNGAGFDMRFVDKLFGVFQRLHTAQEFEGTGIGLASVRRAIQRHGGRTWAEGQLEQGATFYFALPLSRMVPGSAAAEEETAVFHAHG